MKEIFTDPNFFRALIPTTISLVITGLASVIIGVFLEKFKNRISKLSRKITSQPIAFSTKDDYWGHIKVHYNNYEAKNLNLFTIEIKNESSKDIPDVIVELKVDPDSMIFANNGLLIDSKTPLLLTNEFFQYQQDVLKRNDEIVKKINDGELKETEKDPYIEKEVSYITQLKKYFIPVLNRKNVAKFNIVVENRKGLFPIVTADVIQKGIKLVDFVDEAEKNKITIFYSLIIGLIIFSVIFMSILNSFPDSKTEIILTGILGLTYTIIGWFVYQIGLYLRKFFY